MSAIDEHPSLQMLVTPEQRERAERWLQEAYAEDRISEQDFDSRIGQVISANTRRDLNSAFYGLVQVPMPAKAMGASPAYQPLVRLEMKRQAGRGAAGLAHFSVFFLWILGPGLVFALSAPDSYPRREAAKAFNFQVITAVSVAVLGIVSGFSRLNVDNWLFPLMALGWLVLTIVGGAKALQGESWRNPVTSLLKLQVLPER